MSPFWSTRYVTLCVCLLEYVIKCVALWSVTLRLFMFLRSEHAATLCRAYFFGCDSEIHARSSGQSSVIRRWCRSCRLVESTAAAEAAARILCLLC